MHIILWHIGQIVIVDEPHIRNVETSGCNISGNQNFDRPAPQRINGALSLALGFVAMDRIGGIARFAQGLHQTLRAVFGPGKDDGRIAAVFCEFLNQEIGLGSPGHEMHLLGDFVSHLAWTRDRHAFGVFQIGCGQFVHMFRHCRREQHGLALGRQ